MSSTPKPYFTEEYGLFYLWWPEPRPNNIQLAGEFKTELKLQERSMAIFGSRAVRQEG